MQAFLRDDLWSKRCLHQAEALAEAGESLFKVEARITFLAAALVSTAQAATFVGISAIAFVAHVFFSVVNALVDFDLAHTVTEYFYDSFSKLRGSILDAIVAMLSATTHTGISKGMEAWLGGRVNLDWSDFKNEEIRKFAKRVDTARQKHLGAVSPEEQCRIGKTIKRVDALGKTYSSDLYFDAMTNDIKAKVQGLIVEADRRINSPTATDVQKYEIQQDAMQRISTFTRKKINKLNGLPMSYLEVADYRMQKAESFKNVLRSSFINRPMWLRSLNTVAIRKNLT